MIEVGKKMAWHKIVSNYGHVAVYHVTVLKIGKRITVQMESGRRKCVTPARLREIKAGS